MGRTISKDFKTAVALEIFERLGGVRVVREDGKMYRDGKSAKMPNGRTVTWNWALDVGHQLGFTAAQIRKAFGD